MDDPKSTVNRSMRYLECTGSLADSTDPEESIQHIYIKFDPTNKTGPKLITTLITHDLKSGTCTLKSPSSPTDDDKSQYAYNLTSTLEKEAYVKPKLQRLRKGIDEFHNVDGYFQTWTDVVSDIQEMAAMTMYLCFINSGDVSEHSDFGYFSSAAVQILSAMEQFEVTTKSIRDNLGLDHDLMATTTTAVAGCTEMCTAVNSAVDQFDIRIKKFLASVDVAHLVEQLPRLYDSVERVSLLVKTFLDQASKPLMECIDNS